MDGEEKKLSDEGSDNHLALVGQWESNLIKWKSHEIPPKNFD